MYSFQAIFCSAQQNSFIGGMQIETHQNSGPLPHGLLFSLQLIDVFTFGHVLFEMQSTYSLQEPFIREISDCPAALSNF